MLLLDIIIDIVVNIYVSLGYGTPQRKINITVEKVAKHHPEIMDLYVNNKHIFEQDPVLSQTILASNVKSIECRRELAATINAFFTAKKSELEV